MKLRFALLVPAVIFMAACSTYTTPRYSSHADTHVTLKAIGPMAVTIGPIEEPADFSASCRAAGPLSGPDGMTHAAYIKRALEDEMKFAGVSLSPGPQRVISGRLNRLEFSSTKGVTGGAWDIDLTLISSNGNSLNAIEHYEFESGFAAITACKQTAEAFFPAVQNLIFKAVSSPGFRPLLQ